MERFHTIFVVWHQVSSKDLNHDNSGNEVTSQATKDLDFFPRTTETLSGMMQTLKSDSNLSDHVLIQAAAPTNPSF